MFQSSILARAVRIALGSSALGFFSAYSFAQNAPLEVIVVTPVPGQSMALQQVAANVQTVSAEELASSHASSIGAYMNRMLGSVNVNDIQNNPFQPDVNFRGFSASPLLGTAQGMSVYMDGVRLNQPFGDVVSWDLIPSTAIASLTLMPGSNPLFGLNTLGGALNVQTKDGLHNPGTTAQVSGGQYQRKAFEFEHGGSNSSGVHWYLTGNRYSEDGWRVESGSEVRQVLGKLGYKDELNDVSLTVAFANNNLNGNGTQEFRLLAADRHSVYSKPDITDNHGLLTNLVASRQLNSSWTLAGNAYRRKIDTDTFNGDVNDDALDQAVYQPGAAERAALAAAGYSGFPTSGENAANTPFPKWRCIAQKLLNDEPGEKCTGLVNMTDTKQTNSGLNLQLSSSDDFMSRNNLFVVGAAFDKSKADFTQSRELGYLTAERGVTTVGAIADGQHAGNIDGAPYDIRVNLKAYTRTWSVFMTDTLALAANTQLTLSGRYNYTEVENRDQLKPGGGTGSLDGDHQFHRLNPAVGLTHQLAQGLTVYAGANQGSRAPSAIELGCADPARPCKLPNAMSGDPHLNQVVATTTEAGIRRNGVLSWNLGLYRTDSHDDILFVADDAMGFGYFRNFGHTRRQGVEAGISAEIRGMTLGANYTFTDATYRSAEILNGSSNSTNASATAGLPGVDGEIAIGAGKKMPLIPRQQLKLFAQLPLAKQFSVNADMSVVEGSYARGNENNAHQPDGLYYLGAGRTSGYAVFNIGADWQPLAQLTVSLQVNNVFDRDYNTAAQLAPTALTAAGNFQARPFPANANGERPLQHSTFFAPAAPRTAWLGLRYRIGM